MRVHKHKRRLHGKQSRITYTHTHIYTHIYIHTHTHTHHTNHVTHHIITLSQLTLTGAGALRAHVIQTVRIAIIAPRPWSLERVGADATEASPSIVTPRQRCACHAHAAVDTTTLAGHTGVVVGGNVVVVACSAVGLGHVRAHAAEARLEHHALRRLGRARCGQAAVDTCKRSEKEVRSEECGMRRFHNKKKILYNLSNLSNLNNLNNLNNKQQPFNNSKQQQLIKKSFPPSPYTCTKSLEAAVALGAVVAIITRSLIWLKRIGADTQRARARIVAL